VSGEMRESAERSGIMNKRLAMAAGVAVLGLGAAMAEASNYITWTSIQADCESSAGAAISFGIIIFGIFMGVGVALRMAKKLVGR